jgi:NADP-dependent alcohol dehydrogenase
MEVPTSLADVKLGEADIDIIVKSLEAHNRSGMSERQDIGPKECREILMAAL